MQYSQKIYLSDNIVFLHVNDQISAVWNRYLPSVLLINNEAREFITLIKNGKLKTLTDNNNNHIQDLIKYNIVYSEDDDPSENIFNQSMLKAYDSANEKCNAFYINNNEDYNQLYITNDACNLKCNYCIKEYKTKEKKNISYTKNERIYLIDSVIDQYFQRKIDNNIDNVNISFNGGEILLEWGLIKRIIKRVCTKYKEIQINLFMNTNMTLMTEEIAEFISHYKFKVHISIDGYKNIHNKTRKYHDSRESFDDVINGLSIFRQFNKSNVIEGFQGTLQYPDEIIPEEIFSMNKFGFNACRLAPNLLDTTTEDAQKKAMLMAQLLRMNEKNQFKVTENYFRNMNELINLNNYSFFFNCVGLSCIPKVGLNLNISKLTLSILCSYIEEGSIPINNINKNIYHIELWNKAKQFILNRIKAIKNLCNDCEIIGICRGSCILMGLDVENKMNTAACVYQKKIWEELIKIVIEHNEKKRSQES